MKVKNFKMIPCISPSISLYEELPLDDLNVSSSSSSSSLNIEPTENTKYVRFFSYESVFVIIDREYDRDSISR